MQIYPDIDITLGTLSELDEAAALDEVLECAHLHVLLHFLKRGRLNVMDSVETFDLDI